MGRVASFVVLSLFSGWWWRCLLFFPGDGAAASVRWWQTSKGSDVMRLMEMDGATMTMMKEEADSSPRLRLTVDSSRTYQTIVGFGGAFTQAAASVWKALPKAERDLVMEAYFDPDEGLGYTVGRVPINSCDFSPLIYTMDDVVDDFELDYFQSDLPFDQDMISMIREGQRYAKKEPLKLVASPWSPPAWMKGNHEMLKGGHLKETHQDVWSRYLVRWLDAYKDRGVDFWALTVQNEPESKQSWESCEYNASDEVAFVDSSLGPALKRAHPDVKILGFDHNKDHLLNWSHALFDDADSYFDGIAFHWYAGTCLAEMKAVSTLFPQKLLVPSEACYELTVLGTQEDDDDSPDFLKDGSWGRGEGYANDAIADLLGGSAGWIDWNLILDENGGPNHVRNFCDAPILAENHSKLHFHPQYYFLGHLSKFMTPGAVRVHVEDDDDDAYPDDCKGWPAYGKCVGGPKATAARRLDGKIALVVLNCNDHALPLTIHVDGFLFDNDIPAHSIQTYLLDEHNDDQTDLQATNFLPPLGAGGGHARHHEKNHQQRRETSVLTTATALLLCATLSLAILAAFRPRRAGYVGIATHDLRTPPNE